MTIDWLTLVTDSGPQSWLGVGGFFSNAVTSALPIAGAILGVGIAWKLFKKFTK